MSVEILSHPGHVIPGFCSSEQLDFKGGSNEDDTPMNTETSSRSTFTIQLS